MTWEQATQKIGTLNTIVALTYHVHYYLAGLLNVLQGVNLRFGISIVLIFHPSHQKWKNMTKEFVVTSKTSIEEIAHISDAKLEEPFVEEEYGTYLRNIAVTIAHGYDHLG